ncbi:MAG: cation transporter [Elusimicrobia bacterium]|nr:cation transporter [Elusimicrobiota bacterium]
MSSCHDHDCLSSPLREDHIRVLKIVLAVNLAMFIVEAVGGLFFRSVALLGDSMDMLEDALVYAVSLYVMDRSSRWKAGAALGKGLVMLLLGLGVLGQTVHHAFSGVVPFAGGMGAVGVAALAANALCLLLLYKHKDDDINMRSTWLCSRNDVLANLGVMLAAALVLWLGSPWPDIVIGGVIAAMILISSIGILREALHELKEKQTP